MDPSVGGFVARMVGGIRVLTGADLTTDHKTHGRQQMARVRTGVRELFDFGEQIEPKLWTGARTRTHDMMLVVGPFLQRRQS